MLDFQILRIRQVINMEVLLHLLHTLLGKVYGLFLLVYDKVTGLFNFFSQNRIDLGKLGGLFSSFQLLCQNVTKLIELGGLSGLSGNNQRCSRLID